MKNILIKIQKISKEITSLINYKRAKYFVVFFSVILIFTLSSAAQKNPFDLFVKNNNESVNKDGRIYFMELQNKSNKDIVVDLSVINRNSDKNPDESDTKENVVLNASLLNEDGVPIKGKLELKSYELVKFQVKVTVPEGTKIEHWNNLLVNAKSVAFPEYSPSVTLYTFIPNPEER